MGVDMPKTRRSPADYDPEIDRFEEHLEVTEDKTLIDIETSEELIAHLEDWFKHIEVPSVYWSALAKSMLAWMIESRQLGKEMQRPVRIVRAKKRVELIRAGISWGKREMGLLRYRYTRPEEFPVKKIAEDLGRSERSIYIKAHKLRIRRKKRE